MKETEIKCSICGKSKNEVQKIIIASDNVCICDECVGLCCQILKEENIHIRSSNINTKGCKHEKHELIIQEWQEFFDQYETNVIRCEKTGNVNDLLKYLEIVKKYNVLDKEIIEYQYNVLKMQQNLYYKHNIKEGIKYFNSAIKIEPNKLPPYMLYIGYEWKSKENINNAIKYIEICQNIAQKNKDYELLTTLEEDFSYYENQLGSYGEISSKNLKKQFNEYEKYCINSFINYDIERFEDYDLLENIKLSPQENLKYEYFVLKAHENIIIGSEKLAKYCKRAIAIYPDRYLPYIFYICHDWYNINDTKLAETYCSKCIQLAKKDKNKELINKFQLILGEIKEKINKYKKECYEECQEYSYTQQNSINFQQEQQPKELHIIMEGILLKYGKSMHTDRLIDTINDYYDFKDINGRKTKINIAHISKEIYTHPNKFERDYDNDCIYLKY